MGWVLFFGILGAFFMLFFMLFTMDPATGEVSAMGIVFSSAAFVLFLWVYLRFHKDDRQIEEKRYSEERAAFYDECIAYKKDLAAMESTPDCYHKETTLDKDIKMVWFRGETGAEWFIKEKLLKE